MNVSNSDGFLKRPVITSVVVALLALVAERPALSRQAPSQRPKFGTSTAAVLVDVVVRDKKGKPVSGLTAEDFQVFEDGVPQRIISCDASGLLAPMAEPVPPRPTRRRRSAWSTRRNPSTR